MGNGQIYEDADGKFYLESNGKILELGKWALLCDSWLLIALNEVDDDLAPLDPQELLENLKKKTDF